MRRAAIAIPRVARRVVATKLIAFAGVRYFANGSVPDVAEVTPNVRYSIESRDRWKPSLSKVSTDLFPKTEGRRTYQTQRKA